MGSLKQDLLALGMELRETHISEVYLAPDTVYKIKKPVQLGFLDFTTLELRKHYCAVEVQLNQRLAEGVYRGVVPIVRDAQGVHQLVPLERAGGAGGTDNLDSVEYAVVMRRLQDADAAEARLARGVLSDADLARIAQHLAKFHAAARCDAQTEQYGQCSAIEANVVENFEQTRTSAQAFLAAGDLAAIERWQRGFLAREHARFEARLRAGRIRDGHGDLRLEHCYLEADGAVEIIDCIEFNDRFRYGDVCADVAFLAMDLAWHERLDLSEAFLSAYAHAADDFDLYGVVDFYQSYRAYVRGKVSAMLAADEKADETARRTAHARARKYFQLAHACTREPLERPTLYLVGGLIASGKSSVSRRLAQLVHAPVTDADHVRKRLAGTDPNTPWHDAAFSGRYAPAQTDAVYGELLRRAEVVLKSGRSMILDASFRSQQQRTAARELAERLDCSCTFIECVADPHVCRARLRERARGPSVSDGRLDIFDAFMRDFEPFSELPPQQHVRIDTQRDFADTEARLRTIARVIS